MLFKDPRSTRAPRPSRFFGPKIFVALVATANLPEKCIGRQGQRDKSSDPKHLDHREVR